MGSAAAWHGSRTWVTQEKQDMGYTFSGVWRSQRAEYTPAKKHRVV